MRVRDGTKWSVESDDPKALENAKIKVWINGIVGDPL
jgi:hypothetical protein